MTKRFVCRLALCAGLLLARPATAAQLLTDATGYAGPVIDIGIVPNPGYYFSDTTQYFAAVTGADIAGVTILGTWVATVFGQPSYGFGSNGYSGNSLMIATGYSDSKVTIRFDTPVAAFGSGFNYAPGLDASFPFPVGAPTLAAYDALGALIASYDLSMDAPIDAGGAGDYFAFRGIDGGGQLISRFEFSGSYIGMSVAGSAILPPPPTVPEPQSWALMILGFGLVGSGLRHRRRQLA